MEACGSRATFVSGAASAPGDFSGRCCGSRPFRSRRSETRTVYDWGGGANIEHRTFNFQRRTGEQRTERGHSCPRTTLPRGRNAPSPFFPLSPSESKSGSETTEFRIRLRLRQRQRFKSTTALIFQPCLPGSKAPSQPLFTQKTAQQHPQRNAFNVLEITALSSRQWLLPVSITFSLVVVILSGRNPTRDSRPCHSTSPANPVVGAWELGLKPRGHVNIVPRHDKCRCSLLCCDGLSWLDASTDLVHRFRGCLPRPPNLGLRCGKHTGGFFVTSWDSPASMCFFANKVCYLRI